MVSFVSLSKVVCCSCWKFIVVDGVLWVGVVFVNAGGEPCIHQLLLLLVSSVSFSLQTQNSQTISLTHHHRWCVVANCLHT